MKAFHVKLFKRGKKPTTQKLRQWALPGTWKKMALVLLCVLLVILSVLLRFWFGGSLLEIVL